MYSILPEMLYTNVGMRVGPFRGRPVPLMQDEAHSDKQQQKDAVGDQHRFHRQGQGGEHRTEHRSNQDIQDAGARDHPDMGDVMGITGLYPNPDPEGRVGNQDKAKADPSRTRMR